MLEGVIALVLGVATGFFAAIPPGPVNLTVIRYASHGRVRKALGVAAGASAVDVVLCGSIVIGLGWILERVVANPWVKAVLALVLVAYGLKIFAMEKRAEAETRASPEEEGRQRSGADALPFGLGVLQGAANPALMVNWTLIVGFLIGQGFLKASPSGAVGFGLGTGLGAFGWFALLAEALDRLRTRAAGRWIRSTTTIAGLLLVCFGLYFGWKAAEEIYLVRMR